MLSRSVAERLLLRNRFGNSGDAGGATRIDQTRRPELRLLSGLKRMIGKFRGP